MRRCHVCKREVHDEELVECSECGKAYCEGHAWFSYATSMENIQKGIERVKKVVEKI